MFGDQAWFKNLNSFGSNTFGDNFIGNTLDNRIQRKLNPYEQFLSGNQTQTNQVGMDQQNEPLPQQELPQSGGSKLGSLLKMIAMMGG